MQEELAAIAIVIFVVAGFVFSKKWSANIPRMFYQKQTRLRREIKKLELDLPALNTPSTFSQYSKLQRQIHTLEKQLDEQVEADRRRTGRFGALLPHLVTYLVRFGFIIPAYKLWGHLELVVMPKHLLSWQLLTTLFRGPSIWEVVANFFLLPLSLMLMIVECLNFVLLSESSVVKALMPFSIFNTPRSTTERIGNEWIASSAGVFGWVALVFIATIYTHRTLS